MKIFILFFLLLLPLMGIKAQTIRDIGSRDIPKYKIKFRPVSIDPKLGTVRNPNEYLEDIDLDTIAAIVASNISNSRDLDKPINYATQAALLLKVDKSQVSNVDNTRDLNKPISQATQNALSNIIVSNDSRYTNFQDNIDKKADKTAVNNVDNTHDADKPISNATQAALNYLTVSTNTSLTSISDATTARLDLKADKTYTDSKLALKADKSQLNTKGDLNGINNWVGINVYPILGLTAQPITNIFTPTAGLNIFANNLNEVAWRSPNGFVTSLNSNANTANQTYILPNSSGTIALVENLTASNVGLALVNNTTDLAKPISTAAQTALNLKADKTYTDNALNLKFDKLGGAITGDVAMSGNINYFGGAKIVVSPDGKSISIKPGGIRVIAPARPPVDLYVSPTPIQEDSVRGYLYKGKQLFKQTFNNSNVTGTTVILNNIQDIYQLGGNITYTTANGNVVTYDLQSMVTTGLALLKYSISAGTLSINPYDYPNCTNQNFNVTAKYTKRP